MKKIALFILTSVSVMVSQIASAQSMEDIVSNYKFKHDYLLFTGKWEAKQGNNSYELIISKDVHYTGKDNEHPIDLLLGEMLYKVDGRVVRHIEKDPHGGMFMVFGSDLSSAHSAKFSFSDSERQIKGTGEFLINKNDPTKAQWRLLKRPKGEVYGGFGGIGGMHKDWNKKDFDIPLNLQWRKVE